MKSGTLAIKSESWWAPWAALTITLALGLWMTFWPATFFVALITLVLALSVWAWAPPEERGFLMKAFGLSVALRWAAVLVVAMVCIYLGWGDDLFGDARSYFRLGAYIAERVTGVPYWKEVHPSALDLDNIGFLWSYYYDFFHAGYPANINLLNLWTYLYGGFFTWFGYSPLAMQCLNGAIFSLAAVCFYLVVLPVGGRRPARLATGLYLLWPSIFLWSLTGLVESITHASVWAIWLAIRTALHKQGRRWLLLFAVGMVGLFYQLRPAVALFFIMTALPLEIILAWRAARNKDRGNGTGGFLVIVVIVIIGAVVGLAKYTRYGTDRNLISIVLNRQRHHAYYEGASIHIYPERFYGMYDSIDDLEPLSAAEFGTGVLRGLTYLVFAPFPWRVSTARQLAAVPQTLVWSVLCIIAVFATFSARRRGYKYVLPLAGVALVFALVIASTEGNMGTMLRHRDLIVPVVLILSSLVIAPEEQTLEPLGLASKEEKAKAALFISYNGALEPILQSQGLPYLRGLASRGIPVVLLTYERPSMVDKKGMEDLRISLEGDGISWEALKYHKRPRLLATLFDVAQGVRLTKRLIRHHDVGILHARSYVPALVAWSVSRRSRIPWVFDMRGLMAEEYADGGLIGRNGLIYRAIKFAERRLLRDADHIVVLTEAIRDQLLEERRVWGLKPRTPVSVIPCCTDMDVFTPAEHHSIVRPGVFADGPKLIYIGSVGTWYCLDEMVAFASEMKQRWPGTRWTILTPGDADAVRGSLRVGGFPQEAAVVKYVRPEEVASEIAAADLGIAFILPTYSKRASSPTKVGEYLACGLPVVINAGIGDTPRLIEGHRVGVVVKSLEPSAYKAALSGVEELLKEPALKGRCRKAAEEELALNLGVERYAKVYKQLGIESARQGKA